MDEDEREDAEIPAKFLGFTPGGAPVVKFDEDPGTIDPEHGVVIGRSESHIIVAFKRALTVVDDNYYNAATNNIRSSNSSTTSASSNNSSNCCGCCSPGFSTPGPPSPRPEPRTPPPPPVRLGQRPPPVPAERIAHPPPPERTVDNLPEAQRSFFP